MRIARSWRPHRRAGEGTTMTRPFSDGSANGFLFTRLRPPHGIRCRLPGSAMGKASRADGTLVLPITLRRPQTTEPYRRPSDAALARLAACHLGGRAPRPHARRRSRLTLADQRVSVEEYGETRSISASPRSVEPVLCHFEPRFVVISRSEKHSVFTDEFARCGGRGR
jgi:hypothetical protein